MIFRIQCGLGRGIPVHDGGSAPGEPCWYFNNQEDYTAALAAAAHLRVDINHWPMSYLPRGEDVSSLEDFTDYLEMG